MTEQLVFSDSVDLLGILATGLTSVEGTVDITYGQTNKVVGSLRLDAVGGLAAQTYTNLTVSQTGTSNGQPIYTLSGSSGLTALSITYTGQAPTANSVIVSTLLGVTAGSGTGSVISTVIGQAPSVVSQSGSVAAGQTASANASSGALAGDSDPNGGTLSVTSVSSGGTTDTIAAGSNATVAGSFGTLTIGSDGSYTYAATNGLAIVTAPDGQPITDTFGVTVTTSEGTLAPSSLALSVALAAGGSETVSNPTGSSTYTIGATTLTLNEMAPSTFGGGIQDGSSGAGGNVVVNGPAPLTLTGVSTYTGNTSVSGTLDLAGSASIHASARVSLAVAGATFDISGASSTEVINNLTGVAGAVTDLGSQNLKIKVQAGMVDNYAGSISDGGAAGGAGGSLELGGPGQLFLTSVNTYTGATTVDAGTLALSGSGSVAASSGLSLASGATFDISGDTSARIGTLSGAPGSAVDLGAGTLTIDETAATTFAGVIADGGLSGGVMGNISLAGSGALKLTGVETYTGKTSVSGVLDLSDAASIHSSTKVSLTTSGAILDISGASGTEVINKLGGIAGTVTDLGANDLKIKVQGGTVDTYSGLLQDGGAAGGTGGQVEVGGLGELVLNGSNNTYTGGTTIDAGTLDIAALGAAGTGTITFANPARFGTTTLEIDAAALTTAAPNAYSFANKIAGATSPDQVIDLTSLAYNQGSTNAALNGTSLLVSNGSSSVTLQLASDQSKSSFVTASDGHGGTLVYDPPAVGASSAPSSIATSRPIVDHSWIEVAMTELSGIAGNQHDQTMMHELSGLTASVGPNGHGTGGHSFLK